MILAHQLGATWWQHWTFEPVTVTLLILSALIYGVGVRNAWTQAGRGAGIRHWQVASFAGGILALAVAQISPLAWLSDVLFSAHMTQHEILMLVAAPLLVLGQPLLAAVWAVPRQNRAAVAATFRGPAFSRAWHAMTGPLALFLLHAVALWIWHIPVLFEAALASEAIHFIQHMAFVGTAAFFWWGMVYGRYGRLGYGVAILYVFLTALHNTILGALLTIAPGTWYRSYEVTAVQWRVDALADQQLAGLIMWVPSGVAFLVVGLALTAAWLGESERRVGLGSTATPVAGVQDGT
jgi:putative membrane protein